MSDGHRREGGGDSHRLPDYIRNATDEQRERAKALHDGEFRVQLMRDSMVLALDMILAADHIAAMEARVAELETSKAQLVRLDKQWCKDAMNAGQLLLEAGYGSLMHLPFAGSIGTLLRRVAELEESSQREYLNRVEAERQQAFLQIELMKAHNERVDATMRLAELERRPTLELGPRTEREGGGVMRVEQGLTFDDAVRVVERYVHDTFFGKKKRAAGNEILALFRELTEKRSD